MQARRHTAKTSYYDPTAAPTTWRVLDGLWDENRLLPREKPPGTPGRPAVPFRTVFDGILHALRTDCQQRPVPTNDQALVHLTCTLIVYRLRRV
jgi:hypothetical protein